MRMVSNSLTLDTWQKMWPYRLSPQPSVAARLDAQATPARDSRPLEPVFAPTDCRLGQRDGNGQRTLALSVASRDALDGLLWCRRLQYCVFACALSKKNVEPRIWIFISSIRASIRIALLTVKMRAGCVSNRWSNGILCQWTVLRS